MLNDNNRKAELSYAYLHAVAAAAGFACHDTHRHLDGCGVDAQIDISERLAKTALLTDFSLHFQLKATSRRLPVVDGKISFPLDVDQYEKLRRAKVAIPRLIVLMTLPEEDKSWLHVSPEKLVARRCARWTTIRGELPTLNKNTVTVHFDVERVLTPKALRDIARLVALGKDII